MNLKPAFLLAGLLGLAAAPARAQWTTQSLALKTGWNAVFLHVDAGHATLDQLVGAGAPVLTPIEEVWRWNPTVGIAQFIDSPQEPTTAGTQWTAWRRADGPGSALQVLTANTAYLVYATADHTWELTGRPVLPAYDWSTSGLNFFGFPTVPAAPPSFEDFLFHAPALLAGQIYRYPGGDLGPGNPARVFAFRDTPVRRGEAYWLRAGDQFNEYFGPFAVTAAGTGAASFGDAGSGFSFRLRNLTAAPLTVNLTLRASAAPPAGQTPVVGVPPLLVRGEWNTTNLTYGHDPLPPGTPHVITLAPRGQSGAEREVVIGLDRANITAAVGELLAGVLELTDGLGLTRVDLGTSATAASMAGLWVGTAAVTGVSQYLLQYLRDGGGNLVVEQDGSYAVSSITTNVTPVPVPFPLRLILHNPATGPAVLLQRVYVGLNAITNPVIANGEAVLHPGLRADARRISAAHLPWTEANDGWDFSGPLARAAVILATVATPFNAHESNPFLHTYHPDHDTLDARFRNELPQGAESYRIVREISLSVNPPADHFASRVAAGLTLTGEYLETARLEGLARAGGAFDTRRFAPTGEFEIHRLSEVPALTRVP